MVRLPEVVNHTPGRAIIPDKHFRQNAPGLSLSRKAAAMPDQTEDLGDLAELKGLAQEAFLVLEKLNRLAQVVNDSRGAAFMAVQVHRENNFCPTRLDESLYRTFTILGEETDQKIKEILGE